MRKFSLFAANQPKSFGQTIPTLITAPKITRAREVRRFAGDTLQAGSSVVDGTQRDFRRE
jgi:hypothetical protein